MLPVAVLAACSTSPSNATAPPPANAQPATVSVAPTALGPVLVNSLGHTLYLFEKDAGSSSACSGACASAWPPLRATGKPKAGAGAKESLLGTIPRSDGRPQVTYSGHPVYLYIGDHKPGETTGQGLVAFGAGWFALAPAGTQISKPGPASAGGH
jgi:predicted lipoprotein with Yx(FWY)xxD motif